MVYTSFPSFVYLYIFLFVYLSFKEVMWVIEIADTFPWQISVLFPFLFIISIYSK